MATGPLSGVRVLEFDAIGPVPFCGSLLANFGADVVRIESPQCEPEISDPMRKGRRHLVLDLKKPASAKRCLDVIEHSDVLIEGYRPGAMERLGLGPDSALQRNPALVYGRMTGWGETGPLADSAGHDINFVALTGALHMIGPAGKPVPPLNLVGDYGGGALFLLAGILSALHHAAKSGEGQIVNAAMIDGVATLLTGFYEARSRGIWQDARRQNLIDGGAPFYDTYRCQDGRWIALGAIEPRFFANFLSLASAPAEWGEDAADPEKWPRLHDRLTDLFSTRSRDEWQAIFEGTDACVTPVLSMEEAPKHPHNIARQTFVEQEGVQRPAPAPRFSRTPASASAAPLVACDADEVLARWTRKVD